MSTPVHHIHRAHRMHSVDAAYCYKGVAWSACANATSAADASCATPGRRSSRRVSTAPFPEHSRSTSTRFVRLCAVVVLLHHRLVTAKKGSPYSITERRVPELIPVLGSQPVGDVSHKLGGRLPLLFNRPAVTLATLTRAATCFAAW